MNIGERVISLRKKKGLTQVQLAYQVGISQQAIQWIEKGKSTGTKYIFKLAKIFNVNPDWLENGIGEPYNTPKTMTDVWASQPKNLVPILEWSEIIQWLTNDAPPLPMEEPQREFVPNLLMGQDRNLVFAVRVKNDAMISPTGNGLTFPIGTILVADPFAVRDYYSGHYLIGYRSRAVEPIFRQFIEDGDKAYLKPLNPQYPMEEMPIDFSVLGVVIARIDSLV